MSKVRALTYGRYHGKKEVGSTRLRVHQLYKYWPEYSEYQYGENPDVLVLQKVYIQPDWHFIEHFQGLKILDICDPDWFEYQNVKQTLDAVDGVVCPTQAMADFLSQLSNKPIKIIPDRHDISAVPPLPKHKGGITQAVWFGYQQNSETLKYVVPILEDRGIALTVISNHDPYVNRWAKTKDFKYSYQRFDEETILSDLQSFDICLLPQGVAPKDRFKSNNKTTLAWLAGVPVVTDIESLDAMATAEARDKQALECYNKASSEYDVKLSVQEMKDFIDELQNQRQQ